MESDRGAKPATFVPPDSTAKQRDEERRGPLSPFECADDEGDEGIRADIEDTFQRKLAAIRRMPLRDRPFARRAAMDEHTTAIRALQHKRETMRWFRRYFRRLLTPAPHN
jgi:hypothetical protein